MKAGWLQVQMQMRSYGVALVLLLLFGCSQQPRVPGETVIDQQSLPPVYQGQSQPATEQDSQQQQRAQKARQLELGDLSHGQHHPAIAALFAQAQQARQRQHWRTALKYLDQARQIEPRNAAILYRQAWVQLKLGQAGKAEQLLRRAKVFARERGLQQRLDWLLAQSLDAQGKAEAAEAARQRALQH